MAGCVLGQIADEGVYQLMLQKVAGHEARRAHPHRRTRWACGASRTPRSSTQLLPLLSGDTPGGIKTAAALAIGYAGSPENDAKLIALLDDPNARRYAAFAVVLGGNARRRAKLLEVLPQGPRHRGNPAHRRSTAPRTTTSTC